MACSQMNMSAVSSLDTPFEWATNVKLKEVKLFRYTLW
jgi:hypothetical protein